MEYIYPLALVGLAALIHASFQLSISMLTLLSGHALSKKASGRALLRLVWGYIAGVVVMTGLLLAATCYTLVMIITVFAVSPPTIWAVIAGLSGGLGLAVWAVYYRRGPGTALWLPRPLARYINSRVKLTKLAGEAFGLGLTSVIAEIAFIFPAVLAAAFAIIGINPKVQLASYAGYVLISLLPLLAIAVRISAGTHISTIQRWRESNKRFIQIASGAAAIVMSAYVYVIYVSGAGV